LQIELVADGGVEFWNNGLLSATDPGSQLQVTAGAMAYNAFSFLVYFALFSFLAQFIFRYLTFCRSAINF
jgi:hypothetical protein